MASKTFADGIDLDGHPSQEPFVETQYCEVYNPLKDLKA